MVNPETFVPYLGTNHQRATVLAPWGWKRINHTNANLNGPNYTLHLATQFSGGTRYDIRYIIAWMLARNVGPMLDIMLAVCMRGQQVRLIPLSPVTTYIDLIGSSSSLLKCLSIWIRVRVPQGSQSNSAIDVDRASE